MVASRAGVVLLLGAALAACVRNPLPVAPAAGPGGGLGDSPVGVVDTGAASVTAARALPWEWHRPASRTVGGAEHAAVRLPRQWRGLSVAEPSRCVAFDPADYAAARMPVPRLRAEGGRFREPLGCSLFGAGYPAVRSGRVVSAEAAHDAGLCARPEARAAFAVDPDNRLYLPVLVAAARAEAVARGDGEWLPGRNLCWYVATQLRVRRRYGLSVSSWEARLFEAVLRECPQVASAPRCDVRAGGAW